MHRTIVAAAAAIAMLAANGCGSDNADEDRGTPVARPAYDVAYTFPTSSKTTVRQPGVTIRGTSTPPGKITISSILDDYKTESMPDGTWSAYVPLDPGRNEFTIHGQGGERDDDDTIVIIRKRTAGERASEARAAAARAARDRAEIARANEINRREFAQAVDRAIAGSSGKMSNRVAKEVYRRCAAGLVRDFDVCFEAGYKTGSDAAKKTIDKYN